MDGAERRPEAGWCCSRPALHELRVERGPGGDGDDVMCEERELRRVSQAEHGETVIARDEADCERGRAGGFFLGGVGGRSTRIRPMRNCCANIRTW